jgi:threonine synthase
MFTKLHQGFRELRDLGLVDGTAPRLYGAQPEGCCPVATAFETGERVVPVRPKSVARSLAIGNPADGDLAAETARASGGAVYVTPESDIAGNIAELARATGVWGESAPATTFGALKEAVARGELGADDRVVLLVTGDGLKTPGLVQELVQPVLIEPDADALLDRLAVTA